MSLLQEKPINPICVCNDFDNPIAGDDGESTWAIRTRDNMLLVWAKDDYGFDVGAYIKIRYCPFCGRELKED